jgi:hypothetical protein
MSQLEDDFRQAVEDGKEKIDREIEIAERAISRAKELAEQYGLPFSLPETGSESGGPIYIPESFNEKFGDLLALVRGNRRKDVFDELIDVAAYKIDQGSGWDNSSRYCPGG